MARHPGDNFGRGPAPVPSAPGPAGSATLAAMCDRLEEDDFMEPQGVPELSDRSHPENDEENRLLSVPGSGGCYYCSGKGEI